ncbi:non-ribosomal peptide synthetase [Nannocystis radixulma]|uniref:Amino acid adenylation domain-containing protein n=1 Tax=Nannocystis radixulma TaxID=2995305 RepID=A0ABT5BCV7_9BACT|nr:amino acid adenylation domain-containing protein [Nannocystis radixulma]MDC0671968.1 amino acid adenylation domain-containing protein [Nannocystis radixulma]
MSSVVDLLAELGRSDIKLWVDGDQLRASAPPGVLSPAIVAVLKERKAELLAVLRDPDGARSGAIPRAPRDRPLPASFAQQQIWLLERLGLGAAYHTGHAARLDGRLDVLALQRALDEIVRRHESLRTTFADDRDELLQHIGPARPVELRTVDLRHLPEAARPAALDQHVAQELARPFDLARDLLLRAALLTTDHDRTLLVLVMHHIASDGWSIGVLLREIAALYTAFAAGREATLPALPVQVADVAVWQRERLAGERLEGELRYWRERLAGAPPFLDLPVARDDAAALRRAGHGRGACIEFTVDPAVARGLRELARRSQATLFMTALAAFQVLLARYSGLDDVLVGTPVAGRDARDLEPLIGYFVNTLVLRGVVRDDRSFLDHLARVRADTLAAYEHQDLPFERVVEAARAPRVPQRNPLVQVLFALQNTPQVPLALPGLRVTPVDLPHFTSRMDLEVDLVESGEHLRGAWVYDSDRFAAEAMQQMLAHFQNLLAAIVRDPSTPVGALELLGRDERRRILVEWNDTAAEFPRDRCVHALFEEQARRTPDAPALVFDADDGRPRRLTYRELDARAERLAEALRGAGVGPGQFVVLRLPGSLDMVAAMLAVLKAGGAYVPVDPDVSAERLEFILTDTRARLLLTSERMPERAVPASSSVLHLDDDAAVDAARAHAGPSIGAAPSDLAYVIYTSGSTGQPKGVLVEHHSLVAHCSHYVRAYALGPADRVLMLASYHFDASVEQLFPALICGACVVVPAWDVEPTRFSHKLVEHGLTLLDTSGAHWRGLVDAWRAEPALMAGHRLRIMVIGGDVMPADVIEGWRQTAVGRAVRLFNCYGPTEATVAATSFEVTERFDGARSRIPIGRPLANRSVYVLAGDGRPVPPLVPGELYIGGIGPARGYLNQESLTREKFVDLDSLPFALEVPRDGRPRRLYRTGDLVRLLPNGDLEFLGRRDEQVKIRGYRVELGEIQTYIERHVGIREAFVVTRDSGDFRMLVAYIVPADPGAADLVASLREALRAALPEYMVPGKFVVLAELPRIVTSGKVDRSALPDPASGPSAEFIPPRTPTEEMIAGIFAEVLGRPPRLGVHDNFFDLGGNSLAATRIVARVDRQCSVRIPLSGFFQGPTIAEFAAAVDSVALARLMIATPGGKAPAFDESSVEEGEL